MTYILFLQLSEPVWPGLILRNLHWSFRTQKMSQSKSNPPLLSEIFEGPTIMFLTIARVNPQATPPMSHLLNERYVVKSVVISVHVTGTDPIGWGQQIYPPALVMFVKNLDEIWVLILRDSLFQGLSSSNIHGMNHTVVTWSCQQPFKILQWYLLKF